MASSRLREEVLYPYPATLGVEPVTTHCRGTLLLASVHMLQERGHYDRYAKALAAEHLTTIVTAVAATWIPMDVGLAHYRACDSLGLPIEEMLVMGGAVVKNLERTFIGGVLKAASSGAGIGPLTGLLKFATIYGRSMKGGGGRVLRVGPKDVRMEFTGQPLAAVRYFRVAYRGFIQAGCEFFAKRVVVAELGAYLSPTTLAYRVAWA